MKSYLTQLLGFLPKAIGLTPFKPQPLPQQPQPQQQLQGNQQPPVADVPELASVDVQITSGMTKREVSCTVAEPFAGIQFPPIGDFRGGELFPSGNFITRLNFISVNNVYLLVFCTDDYAIAQVAIARQSHTALRQVYENPPGASAEQLGALKKLDLRPYKIELEFGF